jgi:hypothetical protein
LRRPASGIPPLRGPSATIMPNREPKSLAVLQAPCSSPFLFESTSKEARAVQRILDSRRREGRAIVSITAATPRRALSRVRRPPTTVRPDLVEELSSFSPGARQERVSTGSARTEEGVQATANPPQLRRLPRSIGTRPARPRRPNMPQGKPR